MSTSALSGDLPAPEGSEPQVLTSARQAVLRVLRRQGRPMTVDEVARACALHPNTVRAHLDALVDVGFAERSRAPITGRGRPAWCYEASLAGAEAGLEYSRLAVALAEQVDELPGARDIALAAGRAWGRSLVPPGPRPARQPLSVLEDGLERMGFAPEPATTDGETPDDALVLRRCPMLDAARRVPDVVCTVHQGLAAALVESAGGDPAGVRLEPFSVPGGCRLVIGSAGPTEPAPPGSAQDDGAAGVPR